MKMEEIRGATYVLPPLLDILFHGRGIGLDSPPSCFFGTEQGTMPN